MVGPLRRVRLMVPTSEIGSSVTVSRWIGLNTRKANMTGRNGRLTMPDEGCGKVAMLSLGCIELVSVRAVSRAIAPTMQTRILKGGNRMVAKTTFRASNGVCKKR